MNDFETRFYERERKEAEAAGMDVEAFRVVKADRVIAEMRNREESEAKEEMVNAGFPARTMDSVSNLFMSPALGEIWRSADLLVLAGPPGVGKSVAALVWLMLPRDRWNHGKKWVQAGELARGYAYDEGAFASITRAQSLVIDDLGIEYLDQKDRYLSTLEEILSARFANKRPTLATTNLTPEKFKERYGNRIISRINEDGSFVVCGGEDLRRRNIT